NIVTPIQLSLAVVTKLQSMKRRVPVRQVTGSQASTALSVVNDIYKLYVVSSFETKSLVF
ncbi:MAG: hypothetical protein V7700_17450, partial [Halioglobus sp.]